MGTILEFWRHILKAATDALRLGLRSLGRIGGRLGGGAAVARRRAVALCLVALVALPLAFGAAGAAERDVRPLPPPISETLGVPRPEMERQGQRTVAELRRERDAVIVRKAGRREPVRFVSRLVVTEAFTVTGGPCEGVNGLMWDRDRKAPCNMDTERVFTGSLVVEAYNARGERLHAHDREPREVFLRTAKDHLGMSPDSSTGVSPFMRDLELKAQAERAIDGAVAAFEAEFAQSLWDEARATITFGAKGEFGPGHGA